MLPSINLVNSVAKSLKQKDFLQLEVIVNTYNLKFHNKLATLFSVDEMKLHQNCDKEMIMITKMNQLLQLYLAFLHFGIFQLDYLITKNYPFINLLYLVEFIQLTEN